MNLVSLFAGIGGFEEGFRRAGIKTVAAVEIDRACQGVLLRRFSGIRIFGDIITVTANDLLEAGFVPNEGIITAGFPCQDISIAGRGAGLNGSRSGLFWHIVRLLGELRPKWFVLENVPRLLSINGGRDMGAVIGSLVTAGMASRGECWTLSISEYPSVVAESSLSDVLETPGEHLWKYFLSQRAARGILRRANNRGRTLPEPLVSALTKLAQ